MRREVGRLSGEVAKAEYVGRVVDPLRDRHASGELIAADGRSLVVLGYLSTADRENAGGIAAEDVQPAVDRSRLDVSMGGFAPSFNEVNDQTKTDLTKAELIAFPLLALLLLVVFRGVAAAAIPLLIGGISIVGTLLVLRIMSDLCRHLCLRPQHRHRAQSRAGGRLRSYCSSRDTGRRSPAAAPPARPTARTVTTAGRTALFSGFTVAAAMAALVILPQRFLYSIAVAGASVGILSAVIAILVVPSMLALLGMLGSTRPRSAAARPSPTNTAAGTGWPAASCCRPLRRRWAARRCCWPRRRRCSGPP